MADKTFTCTVLTPERSVLRTEAQFAAIPAYDGEIGVLHDRAPLLCRLGVGIVRLDGTPDGDQRFFVDAGFAEMRDNHLTILTERSARPGDVDVDAERAAESEARQRRAVSLPELEARQRDLARATAKLKLAGKR